MKESFGEDGEKARQAAIEISIDRRKEVESERKKSRIKYGDTSKKQV